MKVLEEIGSGSVSLLKSDLQLPILCHQGSIFQLKAGTVWVPLSNHGEKDYERKAGQ